MRVIENRRYVGENGQWAKYTYKFYHVRSKLPSKLQNIIPEPQSEFTEQTWDTFPTCKTIISNPFMCNVMKLQVCGRGGVGREKKMKKKF